MKSLAVYVAHVFMIGTLCMASVAGMTTDRTGSIVGVVLNQITRQPVAGAKVVVESVGRETKSDEAGRFMFNDIPVGTYSLLIQLPGFVSIQETDVVVNADRDTSIEIELLGLPVLSEEVEVAASSFERRADVSNAVYGMTYEEIRRAPGALGDVGRMIQSLPGVASHSDERNDIIARGGSPIENLTTVDGFEVPNVNHFASQGASGGAISMINGELVSAVTFIAGGLPPQHGNRLSSALEVNLREGNRRRFAIEADLSMGGAGLILEGPFGGNGSWLASVRRSYLDLVAGSFGESAVPLYSNYLLKVVRDLGKNDRLTFISLGGVDEYDTAANADLAELDEPHTVDMTGWRTVAGLSWQKYLGSRGTLTLSAAHALSGFRVNAQNIWDVRMTSRNRSRESETTLKGEWTHQLSARGMLRLGANVKRFGSDFDLDQPIGWDDEFSIDPSPDNSFDVEIADATYQAGAYGQTLVATGSRLDVTLGGRIDHYGFVDRTVFSPRIGAVAHLGRRLDLAVTYGRYSQAPPLALMMGIPENRALSIMGADHAVVGLRWAARSDVLFSIEAYDKRYRDYPVSAKHSFLSLASMSGYYDINDILMPMVGGGEGRARGMEIFLQKKLTGSVYGQINYAYSRTEHKALDDVWRRSGFDLPHVLSVVGGLRLNEKYEVSARFAYASGRPISPLLEEMSREQNRSIYDAERPFSERAPAYHRLDLRADRRFHRSWGTLTLYVEADNVYDRKNILRYVWDTNDRELGSESQLSFLILGGLTVQF